jgi:hypothetical protein
MAMMNSEAAAPSMEAGREGVLPLVACAVDMGEHQAPHARLSYRPPSQVDQVVFELRKLVRSATLDFSLAVGKLIIEKFYRNDLTRWRLRGPKSASFRKLSTHPELPMSPGALYRCVAVFELVQRVGVGTLNHLGTSHMRTVLGLAEDQQWDMLQRAERERWTVQRLQREVSMIRARDKHRGGRPPLLPEVKAARALRRTLDEVTPLLEASRRGNLAPEVLAELAQIETSVRRMSHALGVLTKPVDGCNGT